MTIETIKEQAELLGINVVMQPLPKALSKLAYKKAKELSSDDFIKWWDNFR
jgi:hypothetical protein